MLAILLIIAAISGAALLPASYLGKIGLKPLKPRTRRLYQGVFWFALILTSLYMKLVPFALLLGVIAAAMYFMDRIRDKLMDDAGIREDGPAKDAPEGSWRPSSRGSMEASEAYSVLGLKEGASPEEVDTAYKRLIAQIHPDKGGTDYLAAKLNEARSVLKGRLSDS